MDLKISQKKLPAPVNINISFPKRQGESLITWDVVRNPDDSNIMGGIIKVKYNIYRGISSNGIFYKMNPQPLDTNMFEDNNVGKNPNTTYWYKVCAVAIYLNGQTAEGHYSSPYLYRVNNTNRWFKKMNERNLWILKNTGQLFDLYTRKYEGNHCPKCYDKVRSQSYMKDCTVCFGTGFEGGYEPMMQLYVRLKPAETSLDITPEAYTYKNIPGAWTISTVEIKNRDLLIGPDGTIYSVLSSFVNQAAGYLFHQELKLKEIDPLDPLYKIRRASLSPNL
jgi:hypothetical protein